MKVMSVLDLRPRKLGGFEEYTLTLSKTLASLGGESILVFKELPPEALRKYYTESYSVLDTKPFKPFGVASAAALRSLARRYEPDVIHLHFVNLLSFDLAASALSNGAKVVYSDHTSDVHKDRTLMKRMALRTSYRIFSSFADRIVAPSNYVNRRLVKDGIKPQKVMTIHNGVRLERFQGTRAENRVREQYGIGKNTLIVASISQLIPEKGVGYLIDAASLALKSGRDICFIHVGDGRYGTEYRKKATDLGLEKRFIFTGLLNLPEIAAILEAADIFTLPCTWGEAFSLVVLEAIAAGKPLIVTDVGGNGEAVENGRNGLVVAARDAEALANAIVALHDDPELRRAMGQESLARSTYFSMTRWVNQTIDLYQSLV